jgi:hypothetical protein
MPGQALPTPAKGNTDMANMAHRNDQANLGISQAAPTPLYRQLLELHGIDNPTDDECLEAMSDIVDMLRHICSREDCAYTWPIESAAQLIGTAYSHGYPTKH